MKYIVLLITFFTLPKLFAQIEVGNCYTQDGFPYGMLIQSSDTMEFEGKQEIAFGIVLVMLDYESEGFDKFKNGQIMKIKDKNEMGLPMTYFVTVNVPDPECMDKFVRSCSYAGHFNITFDKATNVMGDGNIWKCNSIEELLNKSNDAIDKKDWVLDKLKNYVK